MTEAVEAQPGFNLPRLYRLMREAIERCHVDLTDYCVLTEAATGAYVVTPVLAAMAGARQVYAIGRTTRYGTVDEIVNQTMDLARLAKVEQRIEVVPFISPDVAAAADLITNSGHVRPIDRALITQMKPTAVVSLMYEDWEYREGDIDLAACRAKGVRVVGTNERHSDVDVFSFLGPMAAKLLLDAGVPVYRSRILLVCDNPFNDFIWRAMCAYGAEVDCANSLLEAPSDRVYDAVLVAKKPTKQTALSHDELERIARTWPDAIVAVFWGDVDRTDLDGAGVSYWPLIAPAAGHMGILPSGIGPEPIVRLQAGSLKAAEAQLRHGGNPDHPDHAFGALM